MSNVRFIGLDVHAETIAVVPVAEPPLMPCRPCWPGCPWLIPVALLRPQLRGSSLNIRFRY
jgi:hypothetical protein